MTKKKRKFVSDGVDVLQSFAALEATKNKNIKVHTLILGTMPSDKSFGNELSPKDVILRGGDGPQNYGHARNSFWNIVGSAFGFQRHQTPYTKQTEALTNQGYAVWDVLQAAQRKGSLDSNIVKESQIPSDIPKFILDHPDVDRLVFAANSAEIFCQKQVWGDWLQTGVATTSTANRSSNHNDEAVHGKKHKNNNGNNKIVRAKFWIRNKESNPDTFPRTNAIFGKKKSVVTLSNADKVIARDGERIIELIVMPSTSPANANNRPPEKEKHWHRACYCLAEPIKGYLCPGCQIIQRKNETSPYFSTSSHIERHWFHDCPHREEWKNAKKKGKKAKVPNNPVHPDDIDPFDWYM